MLPNELLVVRVEPSVCETDHEQPRTTRQELPHGGQRLTSVDFGDDASVRIDLLAKPDDEVLANEVPHGARRTVAVQRAFRPGGDDEPDARTATLHDEVRAGGGRNPHHVRLTQKIPRRAAVRLRSGFDAGEHAFGQIVRGGEDLRGEKRLTVGEESVGERAADIDVDRVHVSRTVPRSPCGNPAHAAPGSGRSIR